QCPGKIARRIKLCDPKVTTGCRDIGDDEITFAPVAEQRQEIGDESVDRFYDPGQIEQSDKGGDLERAPSVYLLQVIIERLRDEPDDLPQAFDDVDQSKK